MKVEFSAPGILKGESINSQLFFFFLFFPLRHRRKCGWAEGCSQGFGGISLLVGTNHSLCLGRDRAARSALPRELGWFVSGRSEGNVCSVWNQWLSMSGPKIIPRNMGKGVVSPACTLARLCVRPYMCIQDIRIFYSCSWFLCRSLNPAGFPVVCGWAIATWALTHVSM